MADYINKIRTTEGDKPVNYEALANKPNSLPNPNKIKFTGSVVAEYDGSSEVTVDIPNGASEEQAAQIQTNTNDISELKNKTSELKGDLANSKKSIAELNDKKITKFYASNLGETNLSDSDKGKIQDMMLYGKSIQDGTPTPDNPIEIQSVVNPTIKVIGKNLFNPHNSEQINIINHNDSIEVVVNNETEFYSSNKLRKGVNYFVNVKANKEIVNIRIYNDFESSILIDELETASNEYKFSFVPSDDGYLRMWLKKDTYIFTQLSVSEESYYDGDFELYKEQSATLPYTLNAIPVDSGGNVTIDGQEYIADYVDVERGKRVICVGEYDLGLLGWNRDAYDGHYYFYSVTNGFKSKQGYFDCLCYQYRYVTYHSVKYNDMSLAVQNNNDTQYIVLKNDSFTDASSLKSSLNGVKVYFILETPIEIDLTDAEVQMFRDLATHYPTTNIFVTSDQLDGYTEFNYPLSMENGWNLIKEQLGDTREYIYDMELQSAEAYVNSEYAVTLTELGV